jgi:hypothetical protein
VQPSLHAERRVQCSLCVILEGGRSPEGRHHGVADKLLHGAARLLDLLGHRVVEAIELSPRPLGILLRPERSRADEVGEEDGRDLPLLCGLRLALDRRGACRTEVGFCRKFRAALRTHGHTAIFARNGGGFNAARSSRTASPEPASRMGRRWPSPSPMISARTSSWVCTWRA